MFRALVVEKDGAGQTTAQVRQLDEDSLPPGDVTVAVEYSTLNYKDGLCLGAGGGLVKAWPHVPGVDFAGVVAASDDPRFAPGDRVVLNGWRVGEIRWGGYAETARVSADCPTRSPPGRPWRSAPLAIPRCWR
jgi:acrylyl-CoA reductase (NADPH)